MQEIKTVEAKHIFIDIVNYTYKRSVEAQSYIISALNDIVHESIEIFKVKKENVIFIPTGDGMCISLLNILDPYDIHLNLGLELLKNILSYNTSQKDRMRKFSIRIGINENTDNLIIDINGKKNISGSGINMAARIEGLGDKNQILVGHSVFDKLSNREKYMDSFSSYSAVVKHGLNLNVYQYTNKKLEYLNSDTPTIFRKITKAILPLTDKEAHYIGNCILNHQFITSRAGNALHVSALHVMMYVLSLDSFNEIRSGITSTKLTKRVNSSNVDYFQEIMNGNIWTNHELHHTLIPKLFVHLRTCFKEPYLIVNEKGKQRLIDEFPELAKKYIT